MGTFTFTQGENESGGRIDSVARRIHVEMDDAMLDAVRAIYAETADRPQRASRHAAPCISLEGLLDEHAGRDAEAAADADSSDDAISTEARMRWIAGAQILGDLQLAGWESSMLSCETAPHAQAWTKLGWASDDRRRAGADYRHGLSGEALAARKAGSSAGGRAAATTRQNATVAALVAWKLAQAELALAELQGEDVRR